MQDFGYSRFIREQIDNFDHNTPIVNNNIAAETARKFSIESRYAQRIVNQNMKRLADQDVITHFAKGVYYKPVMTPFGKSVLNKQEYYYKALTCPKDEHIGYEGSPSVLNTVGLTTVMTVKKNIVTNLYRKVIPDNINIIIEKPRTTINEQNYRYLQLADIIISLKRYPVDADKPKKVIDRFVLRFDIDVLKLIAYAKKYYAESEAGVIIDYLLEGIVV